MAKKEIKGRKKTETKRITAKKSIKRRINLKGNARLLTALLLIVLAISTVAISYIKLGMKKAIIIGVGVFFLLGIIFVFTRQKKVRKKLIITLLILFFILGIIAMLSFGVFILYIKNEADPKYITSKLNTLEISRIYDRNGNEIAKLGSEKREKVTYDQLPEVLVDAIVATEDSRFFQHNGLDAPRFVKATIGQIMGQAGAGGASTLSMQVVKNSFTDKYMKFTSGVKGIIRKFEDIYLAVFRLEKDFSKKQIIEFYVNNHYLGGNVYGVEEASKTYFGKSVSELTLSEAAVIAGMFKSPQYYRPTVYPEHAADRRRTVLYLMQRAGYITKEEAEAANAIPIESLTIDQNISTENPFQGFIDTVAVELQTKYGVDPYTTPLIVNTTLDIGKQNAVNSVLNGTNYNWIDDRVQTGVAVLDSQTGEILAIGNGRNIGTRNNSQAKQLNYATQIDRQPGSTAKPLFDYGPGIEYNNWSTYQMFNDAPYSYSNGRSIKNWDGGYYGQITLRRALATSRNIPALKAFQLVKNENIKEFVTNLGITPEICNTGYYYDRNNKKCINKKDETDITETINLHEAHSIGAFTGVSPLEMAAAYAGFSNGGYYIEPHSVTRFVYRQTGQIVECKFDKKQVMSDATAYMISSVLQDVSLTGGTPRNVACKTGTTNFDAVTMRDYSMPGDAIRDSWVVGYSTRTVIGMWYGYDSFTKESIAQGYVLHNVPATIQKDRLFNALVSSGAMESNRSDFVQPASVVKVGISPGSDPAKLAVPGAPVVYEYFKKGTEPTEYDFSNYKLPAPQNLKVTDANGKVTISWSAVSPGELAKPEYGEFGYNVYKDDVLIGWTNKTTYTYTPNNIYGTYKIIATYKTYNEIQSEAATLEYKKPAEQPKPTEPTTPTTPEKPEKPENPENPQPTDPIPTDPTPVNPPISRE